MKKKRERGMIFLWLLLAGLVLRLSPALAVQAAADEDRTGSITIWLDNLTTDREGVTLSCYQVGGLELEGYTLTEEFKASGVALNNLEEPAKHREAADALHSYLQEHRDIAPAQSGETDGQGHCSFDDLEQGIYLIVQENGFDTYGTIQTFLIGIPSFMQEGSLVYDVETYTKGEMPPKPEPPEPSEPEDDDPPQNEPPLRTETPKTGDSMRLVPYAAAFAISLAVIVCVWIILRKREKKREQ